MFRNNRHTLACPVCSIGEELDYWDCSYRILWVGFESVSAARDLKADVDERIRVNVDKARRRAEVRGCTTCTEYRQNNM
jgi:hypothetical protein